MSVAVKICGLTDAKATQTVVDAGAQFIGFNFFRRSPRFVTLDQAVELAADIPRSIVITGLFVDPTDSQIEKALKVLRLGLIQLHGREAPERVAAIRKTFKVPVMKALGIATRADVQAAAQFESASDYFLFDAKPAPNATRPGGNAVAFDWALMKSYTGTRPWMLAGGLTSKNVAAAVKISGARIVDVSSGVETRPGVKSPAKIRAFIKAANGAVA